MIPAYKTYRVNNFICYELNDEQLVLMHNKGIVKVYEDRLKELILLLDKENRRSISDNEIALIFNKDKSAALEFMLNNFILEEETKFNFSTKKIILLTNNEAVAKLASETFLMDSELPYSIQFISEDNKIEIEEDCLHIVFLNPYIKKVAINIRDIIRENKNAVLQMSYVYNNNFYMDSLYFPRLYNPCHNCHIGHIESQLRITSGENLTYQHIIDSIYFENPIFPVYTYLSQNNILNIVTLISNKINKWINLKLGVLIFPEEAHVCTMLELETNQIFEDYSLHWELCDCYET